MSQKKLWVNASLTSSPAFRRGEDVNALVLNALMFAILLIFGKPDTTAHTVAIATVVSSTLIILCNWTIAIASIKSHRENMDYHREYMYKNA